MLKRLFIAFFRQYLFWLAFFFVTRFVFLIYNFSELKSISFSQTLLTFYHALYLDTSMSAYLLGFSVVVILVYALFLNKYIALVHQIYVIVFIIIFSIIAVADLETYEEWGTKLNVKGLKFLEHPAEAFNSVSNTFLFLGFLATALLTWLGIKLYNKIGVLKSLEGVWEKKKYSFLNIVGALFYLAVCPVLIFLGLRGGWQQIPIQQSDVYFSKHNILNLAAINSGWNLGQSIWENRRNMEGNPYLFYSAQEAKQTVDELYAVRKDTTINFLNTSKPNVVMVILESWSADLVASLGGDSAATYFDRLGASGIMFDSLYASGDLSDQGMTAIFSAFPALPAATSIIGQPGKYSKLPCLNNEFHKLGYHSSFLFGGQLSYGNIKAYMYYNDFDRILEGKDFGDDIPRGKLGVHDEYLYARQLKELRNEKQPFFAAMFTMSSHSPYDMPMKKEEKVAWGGDENEYVNSLRYADKQLYTFIQNAKKETWFNNTLFVFVADHSHRSPKQWAQYMPEYRKIPMLFWGNVIKNDFRGYRYKKVCSQLDIAATLLNQLGVSAKKYAWSKNLFNPYSRAFAFYETFDGFGYVHPPGQALVYSHNSKNFSLLKTISESEKMKLEKEGKSFLQTMFQEYSDY